MDKGKKHKSMHRNLTQKALGAMDKDQENRKNEESKQLSQSFSSNLFGGRGTENNVTTSSLMSKSMIMQQASSNNKNSYGGRERISSFQAPKKLLVKPVKMNMSMIAGG